MKNGDIFVYRDVQRIFVREMKEKKELHTCGSLLANCPSVCLDSNINIRINSHVYMKDLV